MLSRHVQFGYGSGQLVDELEMKCLMIEHYISAHTRTQGTKGYGGSLTMYRIASASTPPVMPPGARGLSTLLSSHSARFQMELFG
jgi:hypothetical protein